MPEDVLVGDLLVDWWPIPIHMSECKLNV
jgi:hypothetical protein